MNWDKILFLYFGPRCSVISTEARELEASSVLELADDTKTCSEHIIAIVFRCTNDQENEN